MFVPLATVVILALPVPAPLRTFSAAVARTARDSEMALPLACRFE